MPSTSNYAENKIADHLLGTAAWATVSQVYIKLHIGDPGEDGASSAAGNTTRVAGNWNASSGGVAALSATVTWTGVSTSETYTHISLWDAASGGNPLAAGALASSAAIVAGITFELTACNVTVT